MKRLSLFLLILLAGSLLAPVKAETSYYAVSFDGVDDYVMINSSSSLDSITTELTIVAVVQDYNTTDRGNIIAHGGNYGWRTRIDGGISQKPWFLVSNGSTYKILYGNTQIAERRVYMLAFSVKVNGYMKIYVNGQLDASAPYTLDAIGGQGRPVYIGVMYPTSECFKGMIYLVLVYNRTLSDAEIQAIYENPMNPPTNGLVLWLSPDSVDPTAGVWADKSGNGNDGTIVGATAERVSIPTLEVFTYPDLTQLNTTQVNATLINGSSITTLLPTFPVIPYNTTVTLNISYASLFRVFNTTTLTSQIVVYLLNETVITPLLPLNLTTTWGNLRLSNVTQWFSYWPGGKLMVDLLRLDLKGWIRDVFSFSEYGAVGLFLMSVVWFGGVLSAWFRFKRPESALAYGYVLWTVLGSFVTFTPTPLLLVVTPFVVYLSYQIIISFWKKMSGVD